MNCAYKNAKLHECFGANRAEAERFIHSRFLIAHGAKLKSVMPRLLAVRSVRDELLGVLGFRCAARERLFLENYLDQPIEQAIRMLAGKTAARSAIAEIGNLAGNCPGAIRGGVVSLVLKKLHEEGYEWVVFTGTNSLRNGLKKLGLHPVEVCRAGRERLPEEERGNWGSYFDNRPAVMIGNVREGLVALYPRRMGLAGRRWTSG